MTTDLALPLPAAVSTSRRLPAPAVIVMHALMLLLVVLSIFPLYWMVVSSLRAENDIFATELWPSTPSLDNYAFVLTSAPMVRMLANSLMAAAAVAVGQVITGLLAAYGLLQLKPRVAGAIYGIIALSWLVPFQVTMIPNYVLASRLGLLDGILGLIVPHVAAAFAVMMLYNAMRSFPKEVIDAARIDGASRWTILTAVIAPNLKPSIASLAIIAFISEWNDYFWPLLISRSMKNSVMQIGLQMFMTQEGDLWGPLMAASTLASLPILIIYLVLQGQVIDSFMKSGLR